ncbi:3-dehydroquinate synthase [Sediminibacterium sp.]|uniref:3-dehydroquinate synthase n=1 Tax=Sediminibacterium sp. TaxID=1917865 RepID=UPI002734ABBC|nr:3-dehydroquinate synthase [Sediminibacterium sp.]MDP3392816.1 3-dehydroquinate synthase [Sediminibacterium sp.]MDP3565938.1 3-dehydroquinate synthase [Sediminibacterium sp.]
MQKKRFLFSGKETLFYFDAAFGLLEKIVSKEKAIIVTDENLFQAHKRKLKGFNTIVLKPGEQFKVQQTVDVIIDQLILLGADRQTTLIGFGGGVITDITGYVAGIYMRGVEVGYIPTSLLAMVDAAIGGKNGIDVGVYKNMVGLIRQPSFLIYDYSLLKTLPLEEWKNGFAEIIKHACIKDQKMFEELEQNSIPKYKKNPVLLAKLIMRNALIKIKVVQKDEFEKGDRKLLNFGHTLGHAIENMYQLSHGEAISIGMTYASLMSQQLKFYKEADRVIQLLHSYGLPTVADFDAKKAFGVLLKDKKRQDDSINYILLQKTGKGVIQPLLLVQLQEIFKQF